MSAERHNELVAAVQRATDPPTDAATARTVLASLMPVVHRQLAADLAAMCATHGLECGGDGCHHVFATAIALGGGR